MLEEKTNQFQEFEKYTRKAFDPISTLCQLLQGTNALDDTELDLESSAKKIQFDSKECKKQIETISGNHHDELIRNVSTVGSYSESVLKQVVPLAARIEQAYQRINNEIVLTYDDAMKLQGALKMVHSTSQLLRGAGFFFMFIQQLQECEALYESSNDPKDVLRLARLLNQLSQIYSQKLLLLSKEIDLTCLDLIRGYRNTVNAKSANLVSEMKTKVPHGLGHHNSFQASNVSLQSSLLALYELEQQLMFNILNEAVLKSVQVSLALLSRSLQSQRNLGLNFSDVNLSATAFLNTLKGLLQNCKISKLEPGSLDVTLLESYQTYLRLIDESSLEDYYWLKLAKFYSKNMVSTLGKGGPVARDLHSNKQSIVETISTSFESPAREYLTNTLNRLN